MRLVATGVSAVDVCDPEPALSVTVTSNEPINARGDGSTDPDWKVEVNGGGSYDVWVRAERRGGGDGRIYTITAVAEDASGNRTAVSETVTVQHDRQAD